MSSETIQQLREQRKLLQQQCEEYTAQERRYTPVQDFDFDFSSPEASQKSIAPYYHNLFIKQQYCTYYTQKRKAAEAALADVEEQIGAEEKVRYAARVQFWKQTSFVSILLLIIMGTLFGSFFVVQQGMFTGQEMFSGQEITGLSVGSMLSIPDEMVNETTTQQIAEQNKTHAPATQQIAKQRERVSSDNNNEINNNYENNTEENKTETTIQLNEEKEITNQESITTASTDLSISQAGSNITISCWNLTGITFCDIDHLNYSITYVHNKTSSFNITNISRNVENSDRVLGATYDKTAELYIGDLINYYTKNSDDTFVDVLYLNRMMFIYNRSGQIKNITTTNVNTSSCIFIANGTTFAESRCTVTNDDVKLIIAFVADDNNTMPIQFYNLENIGTVPITLIEYYNYLDCDATTKSGYEGRDDLIALIKHNASADQEEQISKEAFTVCDSRGLSPENDLSKCSVAINDSFYVMQKVGSGTPNPYADMFCGFSTKFTPVSAINIMTAFVNPSTDTDNIRELPADSKVLLNTNSPMDKSDIAVATNIVGTTLQPGEKFVKAYTMIGAKSSTGFSRMAEEPVIGIGINIIDDKVRILATSNDSEITSVGAYIPFNISIELANTVNENLSNVNFSCLVRNPEGVITSTTQQFVNLSALRSASILFCGQTWNADNNLTPGFYTINATAVNTIGSESANGNFTILSDYEGRITATVNQTLYQCNETVRMTINTTNIGNTNFTGNLTIAVHNSTNATVQTLLNTESARFIKNIGNLTILTRNITECVGSGNYTLRTNMSVTDATNGTERRDANTSYYDDNLYPYVAPAPGYENASALFRRFVLEINATDDYAIDTCILALKKGSTTLYTMDRVGDLCIIDINLTSNGQYSYNVTVNDTIGHVNATAWVDIEKFTAQSMTKFTGTATTNLERDVRNANNHVNVTLEIIDKGKVRWTSGTRILNQDFETHVDILNNTVIVNSSILDISLNSSAEISFYNLTRFFDPRIFVNESTGFVPCSTTKCSRVSFNKSSGILIFNVTGFTSFTSNEGTNLTIFDHSDAEGGGLTKFAQDLTTFFANYTNSSSLPINNTGAYCDNRYQINGTYQAPVNMSYNSTSTLYEHTRTFDNASFYRYNISCFSATNANLTLLDNITIPNSVPTTPLLFSPTNGNTTVTNRSPIFIWNNAVEKDLLDTVTYTFQLSSFSNFSTFIVNQAAIAQGTAATNRTNITITSELNTTTTYYWRVSATDGVNTSSFSSTNNFTLLKVVDCSITPGTLDFGALGRGQVEDTTDDSPTAQVIQNTGNVRLNVTFYATPLWESLAIPSSPNAFFRFKIRTTEIGAYDSAINTTLTNITNSSAAPHLAITNLKYQDASDEAKWDIAVEVPDNEPGVGKSSTMIIGCVDNE